jgi:hypothetical protein
MVSKDYKTKGTFISVASLTVQELIKICLTDFVHS